MSKKAVRLKKCSDVSVKTWAGNMMQLQSASATPAVQRSSEMQRVSAQQAEQFDELSRALSDDSEAADEALDRLDERVSAANGFQLVAAAEGGDGGEGPIGEGDITALLAELRAEPTDDEEVGVKFALYEKYLENVVSIRNETFAFWATCKPDFHQSAKRDLDGELKAIDGEQNTGLYDYDPSQCWFVHGMTLKASRNHRMISRILSSIRTKLDLLATQADCPVCFEKFGADREAFTLSCCHKVWAECWRNWSAINHGHAACPL